ncbi:transcriptional regulator, TetR family [Pseudobutyrivibrio sp. YE44]|uniref:TetR/AcrR family transcriptional regulator n=1 Tax=Pseudobutyrivibrio sp. YE44 TaxID=1520802 RepID=UPI000886595F|nr:TetR/AcrR family transcriptional regulator [Pseudobutyrivibrio sp. YE44]SDB15312.1 transcriptional regulator, TetR family [Pseudobutyrivibrio sp. YE44]
MPRDKSFSHEKVNRAIREEFLAKGYEGASIRSIGERAGMTSAGLYRHYADKAAMFDAMVEPLVKDIKAWISSHKNKKYSLIESEGPSVKDEVFGESFFDLIEDIILPKKAEFQMLINCSKGTKYENFIHDFVIQNQDDFLYAIQLMKKSGYPVVELSQEELHMLLSAYTTACFEPIIHNYDDDKIKKYLTTLQDFFMPGWIKIMGLS